MSKKRVLIAHILGDEGKRLLRERDDIEVVEFANTIEQSQFQALLESFDAVHGVVLGLTRFGPAELQRATGLQVVSRIGVGFDAVDIPVMTEAAIPVMVCANANHRAVAEHTLGFMLALAKRTEALSRLVRNGDWHQRYEYLPSELEGREALLIGCGRIGARVATLLLALGMRVRVYDPYLAAQHLPHGVEPVAVLEGALASADYVSLHCPKTAETVGLLSAERLALMKPHAYVINTARGGIVDEQALYEALRQNRLGGAALDVFLPEPPAPGSGLPSLDNVISSPHLAGVSREAVSRMAKLAAGNVLAVFDAEPNHDNAVNPQVFARAFQLADTQSASTFPYPI